MFRQGQLLRQCSVGQETWKWDQLLARWRQPLSVLAPPSCFMEISRIKTLGRSWSGTWVKQYNI
jgi:hypothetical protein